MIINNIFLFKAIQDRLEFRTPCCGFWGTGFWICVLVSGTWILDSLSRIPDSKAEGFRIPEMKFSGFWNLYYVTWCDVYCTGM